MPRLVRRAPLAERVKAYLDLSDWLIWASEELNSGDWDDFAASYAPYIGFGLNVAFIIAQANSGATASLDSDGVFKEASGPGWLKWLMNLLVLTLSAASFTNTWLVYGKKRHYRLFEQPIETTPATPSAQRVRVDSSPAGASPLHFIRNVVNRNSAAARAHPDAGRDVWEVAVWDPNPLCLELFCLFSPLHVVLYYLNLPVAALDPRPSVRVVTTILIGLVLSLQLWWLRSSFAQQIKDNAIISRQVLHEYDSKFVHPSLQKPCRDVGIQTISRKKNRDSSVGVKGSAEDLASDITTYTPKTVLTRTFRTNPNANYVSQYDPDNFSASFSRSAQNTPSVRRADYASTSTSTSTSTSANVEFSPIRPSHSPNPFRRAPSIARASGDGGSLGVYTHAASPLRKSSSAHYIRDSDAAPAGPSLSERFGVVSRNTPKADRGKDSLASGVERRVARDGSPLKRGAVPPGERSGQSDRMGGRGYGGLGVGRREGGRY